MTTKPRNETAVKAARTASCRKRQLKDFLRHCDRKGYTAPERQVMTALWVHTPNGQNGAADPSAMCWPKVGTLAALSGVTERSVTRILSALSDAGEVWIARPSRTRGLAGRLQIGGKDLDRGVNVYVLVYFAPESELRAWAALVSKGIRVEGAGLAKYVETPAKGAEVSPRAAAGGQP
mgnify:FL=1